LVLDNCEHLVDAATAVVTVLLSSAPGVRVLVTSQAPLRSRSESVITLEPLNLPDSVTLFATRAEHQRPQQPEDHETGALVEELCRALDGLPLAIELAAARTRVLPVHEIARRLQDRFTLLRDPTSPLPARQSTLRAAVEWSYDLLFPDDQRGLWALSTFAAGASLSAMEAVLEALDVPPDEGLDIITRLVDRSLASAEIAGLGDARYHLLNSVRALSLERLDESGLADVAWAAQVEWLVQAADRAREGSRGPEQARHLAVARGERATIDAALEWCVLHDPGQGVRLALGFGWTWVVLGAGVEAAERVRTALAAAAPSAEDRAAGLTLCGWFEASGGNLDRAEADLREAMRLGDNRAQAVARLHLSFVHTQGGRAEEALALLDTCRDDLIRFGLAWEEGASWLLEAWARIATGDVRAAQAACARAMTLVRPLGDSWAMAHAEGLLGELAQAQHRFPEATRHLAAAANAADTLGFEAAQAHHLLNLGRALYQAGDHSASLATLQQAVDIGQRCGDARTVAFARTRMAQVLRTTGEAAAALEEVSGAVGWFATAGRGDGAGLADYLVAALHGSTGAPSARVELSHVLDRARAEEDPIVQVLALDSLAALAVQDGDVDGGLAVLATADQLADRTPTLWRGDRLDGERLRRECQVG
jgi:predicted ATPase/predicted negative regulator of RcsB-dependent stress response